MKTATTADGPQPASDSSSRQRVRFVYEKGEAVKFISHQDEFRLWERALRRADLPLLYKQGFNPQPHMQFAAPLGLGMTGRAELLDVIFSPPLPLEQLSKRVRHALPPGVTLHDLEEVPLKTPAPQSRVIGADYTILIYTEPGEISEELLKERIEAFLASEEAWRERERHGQPYRYNLRPLVFALDYRGYDREAEEHRIALRVQMRPGATGRPDELVDVLGFDDFARTLRRERIYLSGSEADEAVMGQYPEVSQAEVSPDKPKKQAKKRRRRKQRRAAAVEQAPGAQSFAEKAGDEFE